MRCVVIPFAQTVGLVLCAFIFFAIAEARLLPFGYELLLVFIVLWAGMTIYAFWEWRQNANASVDH